jgi:hypothetical protein
MAITFIPNDPLARNGPAMRSKTPRLNRPAGVAGFAYAAGPAAARYAVGTADFLFWQSRESALAAGVGWEEDPHAGPVRLRSVAGVGYRAEKRFRTTRSLPDSSRSTWWVAPGGKAPGCLEICLLASNVSRK